MAAKWRVRKFGNHWWLFPPGSSEPYSVAHTFEDALKKFAQMQGRADAKVP